MSPVLFNIYTDDLSRKLSKLRTGCNLNGKCMNHLIYADDMVLLAPSPSALQNLLNECEAYAVDNAIKYNEIKTVCMSVLPKWLKTVNVPKFTLNNVPLKTVCKQKYLGVIISEEFTDDLDMDRQKKSIYCTGNMLIRRFQSCSDSVKTLLFKTYCTNMYGCHLWAKYSKSSYSKLKVAYNCICRHLMKLSRYDSMSNFMVSSHIKTLPEIRRTYMYGFYTRLCSSDNSVINTIFNSMSFQKGAIFNEWLYKLFS